MGILQKALGIFGFRGQTSSEIFRTGDGTAQWSDRNARSFVNEGYSKCAAVFRCVDVIARAASSIPLVIRTPGGQDLPDSHPLARLLARPNPRQDGPAFIYELMAWRLLSGNGWAWANVAGADPNNAKAEALELWARWPDEMKVLAVKEDDEMPTGYEWRGAAGAYQRWRIDPLTGLANIMHWRGYSGSNKWYGMSPLEAAARSVDQSNAINEGNKRLLDNGGQPRGILKVDGKLADPQKDALRRQWDDKYGGTANVGRTPILDGGLDYKVLSLTPKEMDWIESRKWTAQEIAAVYGVPLQVIPLEGSQTFANYEQARLALWEDTVLPWMDTLLGALNQWLSARYDGAIITYDRDEIGALEPRRRERWQAIQTADFLTVNEKRTAAGYEEIQGESANALLVSAGLVPLDMQEDLAEDGDPTTSDDFTGTTTTEQVSAGGMNGAQVTAMLQILDAVSRGTLTKEGAITALVAAFPGIIDDTQARRIVAGALPAPDQPQN